LGETFSLLPLQAVAMISLGEESTTARHRAGGRKTWLRLQRVRLLPRKATR